MKRYFNLTMSAISKGLGKLKAQIAHAEDRAALSDADGLEEDENFNSENAADPTRAAVEQTLTEDDLLSAYPGLHIEDIVSRVMAEVAAGNFDKQKPNEFPSIDSGKNAQAEVYQTWWLQDLIRKVAIGAQNRVESTVSTPEGEEQLGITSSVDVQALSDIDATRKLMSLLYATFKSLAGEFNKLVSKRNEMAKMRISTTEVSEVREKIAIADVEERAAHARTENSATYLRSRASSASWSLSLRGSYGVIEIFLVPAAEIFLLSQAETSMRLKCVLRLNRQVEGDVWTIDGLTADPDELFYLVRSLFKQLLTATVQDSQEEEGGAAILQNLEGEELREAVKQIILAEQNMAQKIVSQQEEIQNRIARDLHDAIIADIMSLKRQISGDNRLDNNDLVRNLDSICTRLREICHDLAPRDLKDWGLQTVIEDLVERLAHRTGADCSFTTNGELPELPYPVQLHIYRIVQESLNNMEKYAQATKIMVKFEINDNEIKITMRDNGRGFAVNQEGDLRSKKEGGTGLSGIRERTEMIRCFFKARLSIVSKPGEGSETVLEVQT